MARGTRARTIDAEQASSGLYDRMLAQLKPDREITAGEFLKRAFTFPQIEKVKVQKFSGGTWNFAEDVDNLGPAFDGTTIEPYLREKYGPWRFRLLVIVNGEIVTQHLVNLDGWQENEAKSVASLPRGPSLTAQSKPVGAGSSSELLGLARERIEVENTARLLQGLEGDRHASPAQAELGIAKMFAEMSATMMTMMRDMMTMQRGGVPQAQEDRFLTYLTDEIKFMREQLAKPAPTRDPDALSRTITTIDELLTKTLNTSLAEVISGTPKTEASGWAATIQGLVEGLKPYLGEIMGAIQARSAMSGPRPGMGQVIPIRGLHPAPATEPTEGDMAKGSQAQVDPALLEVITLLVDALRSKNHKTVDAILMNPPLQGRVVIDPDVAAATYTILFKSFDPRFGEMQAEIAAYQEHIRQMSMADDEEG